MAARAARQGPLVSILVPTFNRLGRLRECLQSIAQQTHADLEAIVINDAGVSVDAVAGEFRQLRLRIVDLPVRCGQVATRNRGLEVAQGEYVAFCDDDDLWLPVHLAQLIEALQGGASLAYSDAEIVRLAESPHGRIPETRDLFAFDSSPWLLRHWNTIPPSTAAYRRDLHRELGPFDEAVQDYWDWDWWLRIAAKHRLERLAVASALIGIDTGGQNASADLGRMTPHLARLGAKHGLGPLPTSNFSLMLLEPTLTAWKRPSEIIWDGALPPGLQSVSHRATPEV